MVQMKEIIPKDACVTIDTQNDFEQQLEEIKFCNSVDSVGNAEEMHETEFIVDITPPKTKHVISGSYYGNTFSSRTSKNALAVI